MNSRFSSSEKARPFGRMKSSATTAISPVAPSTRNTLKAPELAVGLVALVVGEDAVRRIGEPDRAIRPDDDVVRAVQALAVIAVGDDRDAAVVLGADHAPAAVLAADEPSLAIDGVAVGVAGRLAEDADRAAALVEPHHAVVGNVGEDEIAPAGEVCRPLGPASAGPQPLDVRRAVEAVAES